MGFRWKKANEELLKILNEKRMKNTTNTLKVILFSENIRRNPKGLYALAYQLIKQLKGEPETVLENEELPIGPDWKNGKSLLILDDEIRYREKNYERLIQFARLYPIIEDSVIFIITTMPKDLVQPFKKDFDMLIKTYDDIHINYDTYSLIKFESRPRLYKSCVDTRYKLEVDDQTKKFLDDIEERRESKTDKIIDNLRERLEVKKK